MDDSIEAIEGMLERIFSFDLEAPRAPSDPRLDKLQSARAYVNEQIAIMKKHDPTFEPIEPRKIERAVNDAARLFRRLSCK